MNELLAIICGFVLALSVLANGDLGNAAGNYFGSIIIHASGLVVITGITAFKKVRMKKNPHVPLYLYSGGVIGVFTVIATILATSKLNVTITVSLCLLGQLLTSLVVDRMGWLEAKKQSFEIKKIIGLGFIVTGIALMMFL